MKSNLETFTEQFEKMPIYGELREFDKRLTFGQYLVVLKEWWEKTKKEKESLEKELREMDVTWCPVKCREYLFALVKEILEK